MDQTAKRTAITKYLITKGIIQPDDVAKEISNMANSYPPAAAAEKGITDEIDKAYEAMLLATKQSNPTATSGVSTQPTSTLSAAETRAINVQMNSEYEQRKAVTEASSVERLILDRPEPSEQIKAGTTMIINEDAFKNIDQKLANGEYKLLPDDAENANTTNYNTLKAAMTNKTPVEVYIGKMSTRAIGFEISHPTGVGAGTVTTQMTREDAQRFLVLDTIGYILASEKKPGLMLRHIAAKTKGIGKAQNERSVLSEKNKKKAMENGSFVVSREVVNDLKATGVKSKLYFKVATNQQKKDGSGPVVRIIRVSGKADLPMLQRRPEFVDTFGTGVKVANSDLLNAPDKKMAENINKAQRFALATLVQKFNNGDAEVAELSDRLKAFMAPAGGVAPGATM